VQGRTVAMLTQVAPIVNSNHFLGMVGVDIPLSWITAQMQQLASGFPQSNAFLFNEKGLLVSASGSQWPPLSEVRTIFQKQSRP